MPTDKSVGFLVDMIFNRVRGRTQQLSFKLVPRNVEHELKAILSRVMQHRIDIVVENGGSRAKRQDPPFVRERIKPVNTLTTTLWRNGRGKTPLSIPEHGANHSAWWYKPVTAVHASSTTPAAFPGQQTTAWPGPSY